MTDKEDIGTYEYAGFVYQLPDFVPVEGQHQAAWKDRHRRAARECYKEDQQRLARHCSLPKVG